ncbi:helix-turn-helix transcriptional regulator [Kitasatospora sp. NPDC086791]|uniref:helix-turn-helix transcriptional regulator n=1 Tax=Kitasatospora sp. NPDC086791 TaxID=3155178 RepID=UPI003412E0D0
MAKRRELEREVLRSIDELAASKLPAADLFRELHALLRGPFGFDGGCWHGTDPVTGFPTSTVADGLDPARFEQAVRLELQGEDATTFGAIRAAGHRVQTIGRATDGHPERSVRYRELLHPCGYGDELRINFDLGGGRWGCAAFMRESGRDPYDLPELRLAERIAAPIGAALRGAHLTALRTARPSPPAQAPAVAVLDTHGRLRSTDAAARDLIARMAEPAGLTGSVPSGFLTVSRQATRTGRPTEVRVCTPDGQWLALHATPLDGPTGGVAVIATPVSPVQRLPLAVLAHGLSPREQQVALHAARGTSTKDIAALLHLTVPTVQQHVGAILTKTGTRTRRELVTLLMADHLPTLGLPPA